MIDKSKVVAENLCKSGFGVIPIHSVNEHGKCGCGKSDCSSIGKHPTNPNGVKGFTHDQDQIIQWLNEGKNIACATGEPSGIWVLDVDNDSAFEELRKHGDLPETWNAKTGRGTHHFFKLDERTKNLKNSTKLFGGIDVRATGGYVILPPSKHYSGNTYNWVVDPDSMPAATAPDWLVSLLAKHGEEKPAKPIAKTAKSATVKKPVSGVHKIGRASTPPERCKKYLESVPPAISGESGHNHTFSTVCRIVELFGKELDDSELLDCLSDWNGGCEPPWTGNELMKKIRDARNQTGIESDDDSDDSGSDSGIESDSFADDHDDSDDDSESDQRIDYPTLHDDAYCGVVGEIVKAIEPQTEANPAGILLSLLTAFGNVIGRSPHVKISADSHGVNLFSCIVGDSASGKGQSWGIAKYILHKTDSLFLQTNISSGLSSGEGLIERVSDDETEDVFKIPTIKRLLCIETEFAKPVAAMRREQNTLSPVLRSAWDCSSLEVMTRGKSKLRASNAFISILAHITPYEMKKLFDGSVETSNGFANRFLWCLIKSTKSLPHGGDMSVIDPYLERLRVVLDKAKSVGTVGDSPEYRSHWESVYDSLKESKPGSFGAATERGRTQVTRLALLYALLDGSPNRELRHLNAALAVWNYCEESARILFSSDEQLLNCNKNEMKLIQLVNEKPGIMRNDLRRSISKRLSSSEFRDMVARLANSGKIVVVPVMAKRSADTFYPGVRTSKKPVVSGSAVMAATLPDSAVKAATVSDPTVKAATVSDLLDWKNQNGIQFTYCLDKSSYWVTPQGEAKVTPEIEAAIRGNQDTVKVFSVNIEQIKIPELTTSSTTVEDSKRIQFDKEFETFWDELRNPEKVESVVPAILPGSSNEMDEFPDRETYDFYLELKHLKN